MDGKDFEDCLLYTSGGANADVVMAWPDAAVSPLAPETAAMILWSDQLQGSQNPMEDRVQLIQKFKETEASPFVAAAGGYISDIIDPADTRAKRFAGLDMLAGKREMCIRDRGRRG